MILPELPASIIEYLHFKGYYDLKRRKNNDYKSRNMTSIVLDCFPRLASAYF